jgi:hypothetical protein
MGLLFSDKKSNLTNHSRDLYRTECPNDRQGRDRVISKLNSQGHRVTGFYETEEEEVQGNVRPAPTRPRRSR